MRIMRLKEVMDTTGLGRSYIYKLIADGVFPKPVPLGARATDGSRTRWSPGFWRELERGSGRVMSLVMRLHYHLRVIPHSAGGGHGHA